MSRAALVRTPDGWIFPRSVTSGLELLLASDTSGGWKFSTLASVVDSAPANAAYSSLYVVSCPRPNQPATTYLFGALTDGVDSNLRLDGAVGSGGAIVDAHWAFEVTSGGPTVRIFGRLPTPRFELSSLAPTTPCLNEVDALRASP